MTGAAILCGSAALRGGAGLVTVACPASVQDVVAAGNACYMTHGLADTEGRLSGNADVHSLASTADVVAAGPGLGRAEAVGGVTAELIRLDKPLVFDADALNAMNDGVQSLLEKRSTPAVLTPHPGEFARLIAAPAVNVVQGHREDRAVAFARNRRVVLLLKGHHTIVTDGNRVYTNTTGNPGMATGGCGDVLTGVIAALMGQKLTGFDAAVLGAWVHGRAGDLAAANLGQTAMTAADLLQYLPAAFREIGP
jgi:NAD(P)H-hydrate epimerase